MVLLPYNSYCTDVPKMLKIFGKVSNADLGGTVDSDCVQTCFEASDCILAYFDTSGRCQLFNFNETETLEVEETSKADGLFVAFKTTLPNDTCPAYPNIHPVVNIGEDPVYWERSEIGGIFSFQKCVGDWKMFHRTDPEITVCMQVYGIRRGVNQTEATGFCEEMGDRYKVTGVATVDESQWLKKRFREIIPNVTDWQAIWIDGVRNCTGESSPNCTVFDWSDGYTVGVEALVTTGNAWFSFKKGSTPENCLGVIWKGGSSVSLNDIPCGRGSGEELGVACGYRMLA